MADSEHQPDRLIGPATLASLVLFGVLVLAAVWLRSGLIGADRWPIEWLEVSGELARTSTSQVRAAAASPAEQGFFAVDLGAVRSRVEALPWVAGAEVSRHWPDALHIAIVEHRPVARWNRHGLLSDRGEVFEVTGSEGMQGLVRLEGPEARRGEVFEAWQRMSRTLDPTGADIDRLSVDERGAWLVMLDNGVEVVLGRDRVDERLARYASVHATLGRDERRALRVDMRYTNGLAVRWAELAGNRDDHGDDGLNDDDWNGNRGNARNDERNEQGEPRHG